MNDKIREIISVYYMNRYCCRDTNISRYTDKAISEILTEIGKAIDECKNPYPDSVFIEPTKEQYDIIHRLLKENNCLIKLEPRVKMQLI